MPDKITKAATLLSDALGLPADALGPKTSIATSPQWDSIAHMRLILGIEKSLGRRLSAQAILSISSFEDVVSNLE